jgi:hypothetical protein
MFKARKDPRLPTTITNSLPAMGSSSSRAPGTSSRCALVEEIGDLGA